MEQIKTDDKSKSVLGLQTEELAGLSVDELNSNPTAIKMLLHYYRQLNDENTTLKNDNNTLKTYVDAYNTYRSNSSTGAVLLAISSISIGFGTNLLTSGNDWPGIMSLLGGVFLMAAGLWFSFMKDNK